MTKSIATEKEEIIRKVESSLIKDGWRLPVILTDLSQSLDHIASVARQEGREEAIEECIKASDLVLPSVFFQLHDPISTGYELAIKDVLVSLAKLTGKEEKV